MARAAKSPVHIPSDVRAAICAHAREAFPAECCGYLRGVVDQAGASTATATQSDSESGTESESESDSECAIRFATEVVRCRNAQADGEHPTHPERGAETGFVIAGRELFDFARSFSTERPAVAVYHSHTNGRAYFSAVDRQNATADRQPVYPVQHIVVGVTATGVSELAIFAWSDEDRDFVEVARFPGGC